MPSPTKLSELPPRLYQGDNSMARKLNQGSSRVKDSSYTGNDEDSRYSPRHQQSHSPHRRYGNESQLNSEPSTSRQPESKFSDRNGSSYSTEYSKSPNPNNASPKQNTEGRHRTNDPGRGWADTVDVSQPTYGRDSETGDRGIVSATPTSSPTRHHMANNSPDASHPQHQPDGIPERSIYQIDSLVSCSIRIS